MTTRPTAGPGATPAGPGSSANPDHLKPAETLAWSGWDGWGGHFSLKTFWRQPNASAHRVAAWCGDPRRPIPKNFSSYPDHPDHPDQAWKIAILSGPGCHPLPGPPGPPIAVPTHRNGGNRKIERRENLRRRAFPAPAPQCFRPPDGPRRSASAAPPARKLIDSQMAGALNLFLIQRSMILQMCHVRAVSVNGVRFCPPEGC
jgi:hypothetical protein